MANGYTTVTSNPTITLNSKQDGTGVNGLHGCMLIGLNMAWSSNLRKVPTLDGSKSVPDIPKGQIVIEMLVPVSGAAAGAASCPMYDLSACALVDINGTKYANTFHTGGGIRIQDFGEGINALVLSKRYAVFGQATEG